jgi:hypothetical protein
MIRILLKEGSGIKPAAVQDPRICGTVRLRSGEPLAHPEIDLAYTDRTDLDVLVAGLRMVIEMTHCDPVARHLVEPAVPARTDLDEEVFLDQAREWARTIYAPVGTCAMGSSDRAVVDPELRVRSAMLRAGVKMDQCRFSVKAIAYTKVPTHPEATCAMKRVGAYSEGWCHRCPPDRWTIH